MNLLHSSIVDIIIIMRTKGLNQELKLCCFECVIKAESLYRRIEELVSLTLTSASDLYGTYPSGMDAKLFFRVTTQQIRVFKNNI